VDSFHHHHRGARSANLQRRPAARADSLVVVVNGGISVAPTVSTLVVSDRPCAFHG